MKMEKIILVPNLDSRKNVEPVFRVFICSDCTDFTPIKKKDTYLTLKSV